MQTTEQLAEELKVLAERRGISVSDAIGEVVQHLEDDGVLSVRVGVDRTVAGQELQRRMAAEPANGIFRALLARVMDEDRELLDRLAAT